MIKEGYIVCSSKQKDKILNALSTETGFKNYTFISAKELKDKVLGTTSKEGLIYLKEEYANISIYSLVEYIKYLPFIELRKYGNSKLDFLVELKTKLINKGYFKSDELFIKMLNKSHITFINLRETKDIKYILKHLNSSYSFEFERNEIISDIDYYEFKTIEEECDFVIKSINDLILNENIDLNDIKICNAGSDYTFLLNRFSESSNLPIELKVEKNYLTKTSSKLFISLLDKYNTFEEIFDELNDKVSNEDYLCFVNIINSYKASSISPISLKEIIIYELENKTFNSIKYKDKIELIEPEDLIDYPSDYIYFVNFDMNVPKTVKDNKYLSDIELNILGLDTSEEETKHNRDDMIYLIRQTKNMVLTFSETHAFTSSIKSSLLEENELKPLVTTHKGSQAIEVDYITDSINIARDLDLFSKYGTKTHHFDMMFDVKYNTYDNRFKGLSNSDINHILSKKTNLSYTSMSTYFACPFSYYLNYILKLNSFEDTLDISLGNIAHKIFEDSYKTNFNFDDSLESAIKEILSKNTRVSENLSAKEEFYINRLIKSVRYELLEHERHESTLQLDKVLTENRYEVNINEHLNFIGKIDKIYYSNTLNKYIVIDYKTGKAKASLANTLDGYNLQLPSYLYLIKNGINTTSNTSISEYDPIGIYLEHIKINKADIYDKPMKLEGFTSEKSEDIDIINADFTTLRLTSKGNLYKNCLDKVLSDKEFDTLIDTIDSSIHKFDNGLTNGDFKIVDKVLDKKSSCSNCKFKDICFRTYNDKVELKINPFKDVKEVKEEGDE